MSTDDKIAVWTRGAVHYKKRAENHTRTSHQLAYLVLADHCVYEASGDRGGPTQEMIQLAESILGVTLDSPLDRMIKDLMAENTAAHPEREVSATRTPGTVDKVKAVLHAALKENPLRAGAVNTDDLTVLAELVTGDLRQSHARLTDLRGAAQQHAGEATAETGRGAEAAEAASPGVQSSPAPRMPTAGAYSARITRE